MFQNSEELFQIIELLDKFSIMSFKLVVKNYFKKTVQSPGSRVQSPESRVQSPESRVQSPESRVQSRVQSSFYPMPELFQIIELLDSPLSLLLKIILKKTVQSPGSRVQSPESRVQSPESRVQSPESRVQSPESRVQSPVQLLAYALSKGLHSRLLN